MMALDLLTQDELRRCDRDGTDGFGGLSTERGMLPLKVMDVRAKIAGLIATTEVRQSYVNNLGTPLEATYIFPLPDRAAVTRFVMEVAGRVVEGVIKERGQARRDYDRAIAQGQRAAITEEERSGVFTMRVGNIMPGETATVTLTLTGPLPYDEGEATFRFPLVVAPRYIPGKPLGGDDVGDGVAADTDQVPDASRITPPVLLPGYPYPVRLSLEVELQQGVLAARDLKSSLHTIVDQRDASGRIARVHVVPGERLNRDFILRFGYGNDAIGTSLELQPDAPGASEGTFLLTLVPPVGLSRSTKPREVIFVLDRSGSMGGWKMVAARRAVARMVDSLSEKDAFNVYAFDDQIETPSAFSTTALVAASNRNRFQAIEFLAKVDARGGTEMQEPLVRAAHALAGGYQDRERVMVLITDGQVGNEDQILRSLEPNLKNVKVFALGIDRSVNEAFLKRLSNLGGGLFELVESEDRLDEVMDRMHRRIGTPVVTETALLPSGLEIQTDSVVPRRLPDLFAGAPVLISGRYRGQAKGHLEVQGRDASNGRWSTTIQAHAVDNPGVTAVWARGQVRELEDLFVVKGGGGELEKKIVATSIRFGVLCRFTAFLAVDKERVNLSGNMQRVTQAVESPDGWAKGGGGPTLAKASAAAPSRRMAAAAPAMDYESRPMASGAAFEMADEDAVGGEFEGMDLGDAQRSLPPPAPAGRPMGKPAPMLGRASAAPERAKEKKRSLIRDEAGALPAPIEAKEELERLAEWVKVQQAQGPAEWPNAFPDLVVDLDRLASALSESGKPAEERLGERAQELLAAARAVMAGRKFEEVEVRGLLARLAAFLDEVSKAQGGGGFFQRLGSFWKS
ncbi:MAG: VWA domain-containing protein [Deltaproteobacteria bacterium]|nr:VWA domain-containing protein [Deltaproteobacteria bacterium]